MLTPKMIERTHRLEHLYDMIRACEDCELRESCTAPVPGLGPMDSEYMLIGEAPGKNEDETGVPFVGDAGKKLNKLLAVAKIDINKCYITNVVKCRPPSNRDPRTKEIKVCRKFLDAEIELVNPSTIIVLGRVPLSLFSESGIKKLHGTAFDYKGRRIIAQYHPAAALHNPRIWAPMINDWEFLPNKAEAEFVVGDSRMKHFAMTVAVDVENDEQGRLGEWSVGYKDANGKLTIVPYVGMERVTFSGEVVFHNAKYDLRVLANNRVPAINPTDVRDTMIAAYCLGMGQQDTRDTGRSGDRMVGGLGLKYLTRRQLGWEMQDWSKDIEDKALYNAKDTAATLSLWNLMIPRLPKHFWDIDMPLLDVLIKMEDRGIRVDPDFLVKYTKFLDDELAQYDLPLNPNSTAELQSYVYGTLEIEPWKFTESGAPAVSEEVLETIDDKVIRDILAVKHLTHERNNYVEDYARRIDHNHRIHTEFKQTSTATGRLSSANPNLQNISREENVAYDEHGTIVNTKRSDLRKLFVASPDKTLVVLDFSQLELRVFAALTKDEDMLRVLLDPNGDIHRETAAALGITRHDGKTINFLMIYEGSAWKISQEFHIPIDKAQAYIDLYYGKYKTIREYHKYIKVIAHRDQRITNSFGRTRRIDGMFSSDRKVQRAGERQAINMPVQSDAGDIVKLCMIDLHRKRNAPMLLQVHDELVFEVPTKEAKGYALWLKEYVPTLVDLNGIRFPVEVGIGQNWSDAKHNVVR